MPKEMIDPPNYSGLEIYVSEDEAKKFEDEKKITLVREGPLVPRIGDTIAIETRKGDRFAGKVLSVKKLDEKSNEIECLFIGM